MEFLYTKNPDADRPIIVVDKHIGYDDEDGAGIMGEQFLNEFFFLANAGKKSCEVWINSPGGKMMQAYDIIGTMKRSPMKADTLNIGVAASCGGWIQLYGKRVRMMDYATFMCHDPEGESEDDDAATEAMTLSVAKIISEGSGRNGKNKLTMDEALALMKRTTFLTAQECLEMGLCDEVVASGTNAIYATMDDKWQAGKQYLNSSSIIIKNTKMELTEITNVLELNEDATAKSMAKAITKIKNEMADAKKELTETKNELEEAKNKVDAMNDYEDLKKKVNEMTDTLNSMTDKCAALETENNSLKAKEVEAEENRVKMENAAKAAQLENDCKNMVNAYTNKIGDKDEHKAPFIEAAKSLGIEHVKGILERLPLFTNGTKIKTADPVGPDGKKPDASKETTSDVMKKLYSKRQAEKK